MEPVPLKRRLTAILLADVVGYSRLMSTDEDDTHSRFAAHVSELIEPKIAEYGGRPVRSMGDGLLVEFESAVAAVRCAVDIQRGLAQRDAQLPEDRRIRLRIGINTGDVIIDDRDIYGNSVNIAARLEALAGPGEIYVTQSVYDQLRSTPALSFTDQGEFQLKNIEHSVRAFRVEYGDIFYPTSLRGRITNQWRLVRYRVRQRPYSTVGLPVALAILAAFLIAAIPSWHYSALLPRSSIVVLPFRNLSGDPAQDYFADAVTDDLTTDLSRVPGAFVIARATAFTYKGRSVDAREVGRECGVRYLLEGSIQKQEQKVQINAQLIDTKSGAAIWGDRFVREVKDLWQLQDDVTGRIAASLDIQLARAESQRAVEERSSDPSATDLRYRAMGLYINGITPQHTLAARKLLEEAVRRDPKSGQSWAWLADLLASDYLNRWNDAGQKQLDEAQAAVQQALGIAPDLALAHFANGFIHRARGENAEALESFSEALKLDPNFARAYTQKANELINAGRPGEAPPLVQRAILLSPRDPSLGVFYWNLGRAQFFAGHYSEAIPWLRKAVELRPNLWHDWLYLVSAYALTGNDKEAVKILSDFRNYPQFRSTNVTLAVVENYEKANPSNNPVVVEARRQFHEGLLKAGMAMQ